MPISTSAFTQIPIRLHFVVHYHHQQARVLHKVPEDLGNRLPNRGLRLLYLTPRSAPSTALEGPEDTSSNATIPTAERPFNDRTNSKGTTLDCMRPSQRRKHFGARKKDVVGARLQRARRFLGKTR